MKYLIGIMLVFALLGCASVTAAVEPPVDDIAHILGVLVDPADIDDRGPVTFLLITGDEAKSYLAGGEGNLRLAHSSKYGDALVYLDPAAEGPSRVIGIFDFKIVSGKSADRVLISLGKSGHLLKEDDTNKVIYLLLGEPAKDI